MRRLVEGGVNGPKDPKWAKYGSHVHMVCCSLQASNPSLGVPFKVVFASVAMFVVSYRTIAVCSATMIDVTGVPFKQATST
jgi:hypothetical protein